MVKTPTVMTIRLQMPSPDRPIERPGVGARFG